MARPRLKIDPDQVERMAERGNTIEDMAVIFNCSRDTLEKRFSVEIAKGRAKCRRSLRDMMWAAAVRGNITMQIFLSKQMLGYSDKAEQRLSVDHFAQAAHNKKLEEIEIEVRTMLLDQPPKELECLGLLSLSPSPPTSSPSALSTEVLNPKLKESKKT